MSYSGNYFNRETRLLGAAKGIAVTDTAGFTAFPANTAYLGIEPRNFTTAVVAMVRLCPFLVVLKTVDALVTAPTDYTDEAQDGSAATDVDLDSLSTLANGDALYVGSALPFSGVNVDVDGSHPNGTASVLTVSYWGGTVGSEVWSDISDTDGTISSGKTMAQDGSVTWTVPTGWKSATLRDISSRSYTEEKLPNTVVFRYCNTPLYWTRWEVSVALDSDTLVDGMLGIGRGSPFELVTGRAWETVIRREVGGHAGIELDADAGTLNMTAIVGSGSGNFTS